MFIEKEFIRINNVVCIPKARPHAQTETANTKVTQWDLGKILFHKAFPGHISLLPDHLLIQFGFWIIFFMDFLHVPMCKSQHLYVCFVLGEGGGRPCFCLVLYRFRSQLEL